MGAPSIGMAAPLPTAFAGTPQQWFEQMIQRMSLENMPVGFVTSDTMPVTNQGPWLKNGKEIWVWDENATPSPTYVPQSLSWLNQQIYIGDINSTAPDPTLFQIWLQTNGSLFVGFAVYMGSYVGWVTPSAAQGVASDSITTDMLQDGSVTSTKIAAGAVTTAQLMNGVPVSKLAPGSAGQVLRTESDGATVAFQPFIQVGTEHTYSNNPSDTFTESHGLSAPPGYIRLVLVCKTADAGFLPGQELDCLSALYGDPAGGASQAKPIEVFADSTYITVKVYSLGTAPNIRGGTFHAANWKLKVYWAG